MSSQLRHPDGEQLLRYADGELPARQARKIKTHLESCWQCRAERERRVHAVGEGRTAPDEGKAAPGEDGPPGKQPDDGR